MSEPAPPRTHAEASRQRRDIASGEVMEEARLIRFVAGPDDSVVPDLGRDLPGRGFWVEATRAALEQAIKRQAFIRSAKRKLTVAAGLPDQVEGLLARRCLDRLGLARRAGALTSGFEKTAAALAGGQAVWLIEASDGSADGRHKLLALIRRQTRPPQICGAFSGDELSLALGRGHAIHSALLAGRWSQRWSEEIGRLAGFRPLQPAGWSHPESSGQVPQDLGHQGGGA
jgi:predicted RNA-binding protein YlxR (DUF448 family)